LTHVDEVHQRSVLEAIHESHEQKEKMNVSANRSLDVRNVVPRERHTLIFDTLQGLKPSGAFVLINDHDPKPLYLRFQAKNAGHFSWEYLEQGPDVWRVRIGRQA
jgi:uncharacterized protein (DUF2249 family)